MEEFRSAASGEEGGLRELVRRWFTDTQAPHILHDGSFPDWFRGFAARKDAEDLLEDKSLGCFLIRLSDKTIGYILSYRGRDRCRHLVITQNTRGEFRMRGDCRAYSSLTELIEFHKFSPIQPFREHLTSSCLQANGGDLYDVVSGGRSGVSVLALRSLWDQKPQDQQLRGLLVLPPALPPKCKNRRLTGDASKETFAFTQGGPRRSQSPRGTAPGDQRTLEGQVDQSRASRRASSSADEDQSSSPPPSPAAPLKATRSLQHPEWSRSASDPPPEDQERFRSNPLYLTSGGFEVGSAQQSGATYSEVLQRSTSTRRSQETRKRIPKEVGQGRAYESVEETKKNPTWGRNNLKWGHSLPEPRKK